MALSQSASILEILKESQSAETPSCFSVLSEEEKKSRRDSLERKIEPLKRRRAAYKGQITTALGAVTSTTPVSPLIIESTLNIVSQKLEKVKEVDTLIEEALFSPDAEGIDIDDLLKDLDEATIYHSRIGVVVLEHQNLIPSKGSPSPSVDSVSSAGGRNQGLSQFVRLPSIKCITFSGSEKDCDYFRTFLNQFESLIGFREDLDGGVKLMYLKSYLSGEALREVEHLSNSNTNYLKALEILKGAYLDIPRIVESLFHKLHSAPRIAKDDFDGVKAYFASVRSILNELQGFDCDLSSEGSPGCRFVSHIMTDTLPRNFLQEMQRTTNVQYPSIGLLFDSYQATLHNLRKFSDFPEKSSL